MTQPKVLIVDDDEDLHTLYSLYLQGESMIICHAHNGIQGLELVMKEKPDLIVLDMIMPEMDGEEFFVKLRTEKKITGVPVIIASVNDKLPDRITELGNVYAVLKKPFTIETLVGKIKEALAQKK
ncbi:MAG: response regulator [Candidatus Omnitrophica bacterium]|nr:response regulator [Candidatus Omnitrophota bacterium]